LYNKTKGTMVYKTEVEGLYLDLGHTDAHSLSLYQNDEVSLKELKNYSTMPFAEEWIFVGTFRGKSWNVFLYAPVIASFLAFKPSILAAQKPALREAMFVGAKREFLEISGRYGSQCQSSIPINIGEAPKIPEPWLHGKTEVSYQKKYSANLLEEVLDELENFLLTHEGALMKVRDREENQIKVLSNVGENVFNNTPVVTVESVAKNKGFDSLDSKL
jgi:hypothetical protein